jgi:hypothetical protein
LNVIKPPVDVTQLLEEPRDQDECQKGETGSEDHYVVQVYDQLMPAMRSLPHPL